VPGAGYHIAHLSLHSSPSQAISFRSDLKADFSHVCPSLLAVVVSAARKLWGNTFINKEGKCEHFKRRNLWEACGDVHIHPSSDGWGAGCWTVSGKIWINSSLFWTKTHPSLKRTRGCGRTETTLSPTACSLSLLEPSQTSSTWFPLYMFILCK